jgi:hypothetical protein
MVKSTRYWSHIAIVTPNPERIEVADAAQARCDMQLQAG